jgi:hypothetical protein
VIVTKQLILRISPADLDHLMTTLDVKFVALSECLVSAGHRLEMGAAPAPGIHYNLTGTGRIYIGDEPAIDLVPHTLIVVPPGLPFRIEVSPASKDSTTLKVVDGRRQTSSKDGIRRFIAGSGTPDLIMICGFFRRPTAARRTFLERCERRSSSSSAPPIISIPSSSRPSRSSSRRKWARAP